LITQWVVGKADQTEGGIPVHPPVCLRKVEKPEIPESQVTRGLSEDAKVKGKNN
jgi:hypothetical protein